MAVVTLASATGSPGVTTTALGLVLHWPGDALLVDADREPAQSLQAGYLRGTDLAGRGLGALARAHREHRSVAEETWLQTVALDDQGGHQRRLLPGFTHPAAAALFAPVWGETMDCLAALESSGLDVVLDAGRISSAGLPPAVLAASDRVLVCTRSSLRSLASLRMHLPTLAAQLEQASSTAELGLLVVGPGRPYAAGEIQQQFGAPVATIAWEPRAAEVFSDGATPPRGLGNSSLARSYRACASQLAEQLHRRRELVGSAAARGRAGGRAVEGAGARP